MSTDDKRSVDGRRRTWIKADVFFYSGALGQGLREQFGLEGLVCFDAFLRACKVSSVEGQIRYANDDQFLAVVGVGPISWTNDHGVAWSLDELWKWLGSRHMTAKRRSNGVTTVESRRWDEWQTRRSPRRNTTHMQRDCDDDAEPEKEKESENYREIKPPLPPLADFEDFTTPPEADFDLTEELERILTADPSTLSLAEQRIQLEPWKAQR